MINAPNPLGTPDRILVGAAGLLTRARRLVDAGIQVSDWSDHRQSIQLEECAALLFRARTEVVVAIRAAARERGRLQQTKVSRRKGHRPQDWLKRDPSGRIIGFDNVIDAEEIPP